MSVTARAPEPRHGFRHEAYVYHGAADFTASTVSFVREGIAREERILVAVLAPRIALLRDALGSDARAVEFVDMAVLGANPARIIPAWYRFADESAATGRAFRGVGEPIWAGRRPVEVLECQLHEALLNTAFAGGRPWLLRCPYDADALDPAVITAVERSHALVVDAAAAAESPRYTDDCGAAGFAEPLPEPSAPVETAEVDARSIPSVRDLVRRRARSLGVDEQRVADLELAVHEIATNTVRHGGGKGTLRVWQEPDALVVDIRDSGHIGEPLVGRRIPPLSGHGGRGLWLAHQLCDLVQVRSSPPGTTVRVRTWL